MPATAEQLQAQIDGLNAMLANGIKSSGTGDKRVEFRSLDEIRAAIASLQGQLNALTGTTARRSYPIIACKDL